jgi:hypothetical protein
MDRDLSARIRERAYEIWMANGCRHGQAEQHWFAAEQEILAGSSFDAKVPNTPAKANKRRATAKRSKERLRYST